MAAPNYYRAYTVTIGGTAMTGILSIKVKVNGQVTDITSDALDAILAVFVDARVAEVTIELTDVAAASGYSPGDMAGSGGLVVVYQKRQEGRGAAGSGNKTATFSNATLVDSDIEGASVGAAKCTLTFRCSSPTGGSPVTWS
jgi:hypothetical protein